MKTMRLTAVACVLLFSAHARADTFVLDYTNLPSTDPATNFEADCLGDTEAETCFQRAAVLEAELVEILGSLEGRGDAETIALFERAVGAASPNLQRIGLRYFSRKQNLPATLATRVKEFFFGPQASVGQPSAVLLSNSEDDIERYLADLYLEARPTSGYGGYLPQESGEHDPWAHAQAQDWLWDSVHSFGETQRFAPAERLLMVDRSIQAFGSNEASLAIPVTGFVTDANTERVISHFSTLFGSKPYPSLVDAQAQLNAINVELLEVQQKLLAGDTSVAPRLQALLQEMEPLHAAANLGVVLSLEELGRENDVFWVDGKADDAFTSPLRRAVSVGAEEGLEGTAIRYFSGTMLGDSSSPDGGDGDGGDGDGGDGDGGDGDEGDGDAPPSHDDSEETPKKSGGGCAAYATSYPTPSAWMLLGMTLAGLAFRSRSVRRKATEP